MEKQHLLDFAQLSPYQARRFVPANADLTDLKQLKDLFALLIDRTINSDHELKQWLQERSELEAALDQEGSILYIRMTCQTDDPKRSALYKDFIERVIPAVKPLEDQLNRKLLKDVKALDFKDDYYSLYLKKIQVDVELFVQDNISLETRLAVLSQEYQTVCGAMTVQFAGEEKTLPQMAKYQLDNDRDIREKAWRATCERRLKDKDRLDEIFGEMMQLRHKVALNAGFKNYADYKFKALHRFDYSPADCKKYHQTARDLIVPVWEKIVAERKKEMALKELRPWDMSVDPLGRDPLKPFGDVKDLVSGCQKIFEQVDSELGEQFAAMAQMGLLELESRKGKAPGGYQSALSEARKPFIFMNAVGLDGDVRTLLHEGGHAFHSLACAGEPLLDYRHGPMEFNEVASMAMELLGGEYISAFYGSDDEKRSRLDHLEDIVFILLWVANVDAFQHWLYENPQHSRADRNNKWVELYKLYGSALVSWDGLAMERATLWHRQLHIFEVPFYYIEYGIAQLGALQVWFNAKNNWPKAIAQYRQGLSLGGTLHVPQLYRSAGIRFAFSRQTVTPLMAAIAKEIDELKG